MTIGMRTMTTFAVGLAITAGSLSSIAQEPAAKKATEKTATAPTSTPAVKKKGDSSRRVPAYFGQVGLSTEQRESIYKIRKTHQEKIDALKKQIAEAEAKSLTECEGILTETQKKLVENLRAAAAKNAK